ncbi:MAG: hypothetical protein KDA28_13380 [Phycisphaerales bacterium]|nr:hypothetical protein [Phycisphaerales bacterium]
MTSVEGSRRLRRSWIITSLGTLALLLLLGPTVPLGAASVVTSGEDVEVKVLDEDKVYYPKKLEKGAAYDAPATLETSKVFDEIDEWKEIVRKKLTPKDAEYHLLLKAANKKFDKAVKKVQKKDEYDIIAEDGAIKCKGVSAKDVTQDTIDSLPND